MARGVTCIGGQAYAGLGSLLGVDHPVRTPHLSTDARKSSQIPVTAIDLPGKMGHAKAKNLSSLGSGADPLAAGLTE
jgi:hypothetical protein